ncbi:MAG TPA: serine/threonine-protein kinase [Thermoanaerobaculia bacterium]|nr:serine/threonine-protein kinase [Thermoanaerobaculia bacterium]
MLCNLCGSDNREAAKFCDRCGAALDGTITRTGIDPELDALRKAFEDRFAVESLLGRGGMGSVYKARELTLDRHVALKIVPESRRHDAQFVERFRREARIAARLRHPRIVSVHDVGTLGGFPYFSMDYIEGSTLRALVRRRGPLPYEDAISVVVEICRAVAHAHAKGVIHRDLKPENVMIDTEGDVFVMDFGLARVAEEPGLTQSGMIIGTPFYMSPEQLGGEKLDERSDVYSIGLVLYHCLTGQDLFAADGITAVIAKHTSMRVRDVLKSGELLRPNTQDLVVSMLEEDPNMRTRSVKEVLERLTLRKIVALGLAATEDAAAEMPTLPFSDFQRETVIPVEDQVVAVAAERRKARLRALLDEM